MIKKIIQLLILPTFAITGMVINSCTTNQLTADSIVINGIIWTGNPDQPSAEAMAISGDSIFAVGSTAEIQKFKGDQTEVVDASGNFIVPGFIDAHVHFLTGGFNLASVQLRDAKSQTIFINRFNEYVETIDAGTWIQGGDWDHENWGGELPSAVWIDSVTSNNPVFVNRLDGHMGLANTAAMKLAGITTATKDVAGGTIVRDKNGNPTGIFKDNAMELIAKVIPPPDERSQMKAIEAAMKYVASNGVTSVHNMDGNISVLKKMSTDAKLITRFYANMPLASWERLEQLVNTEGRGDKWVKIGGLKGFVDGSLGSHTAAFLKPFSDAPADSGFFVNTEEDLYQRISGADKAGLNIMVHAIGDRAIETLLDIFKRVTDENGDRDRRFRIEHAQHIAPGDFKKFADQQIIASMQPYHAIDDGRWAEKIIGDRINTTYAFRSLLDAGATLAFGSDWFVAPPTPLEGIYAAVTRRTLDNANPEGWVPAQKITVEEALRAYTMGSAYAAFDEKVKGSLEVGKLADFVILDQDITNIDPVEIRNVKVLKTFVGGKEVYSGE